MPLIQIEQDNPDTLARVREIIADVANAPNDHRASFDYATALGWIVGLLREQVISLDMSETLRGELDQVRRAWRRPTGAVQTEVRD